MPSSSRWCPRASTVLLDDDADLLLDAPGRHRSGALRLALNACDERQQTTHNLELEQVRELLLPAPDLSQALAELKNDADQPAT